MICIILIRFLEEMGYFTREEFVTNLDRLGVTDNASLKKTILAIEKETMGNTSAFTELYKVRLSFSFYSSFIKCTGLTYK